MGIQNELSARLPNLLVYTFDEIDSTNSEAKRQIMAGRKERALYLARTQSCGRGRCGRSFFSPKDTGLYLTLAFPVEGDARDFLYMTAASAVAVTEALEEFSGKAPGIKWVNDIYLDGKKIAGILTESVTNGKVFVIIGIGINLSTDSFPSDLSGIAGSLGGDVPRAEFIARICERLLDFADKNDSRSFLESYRCHSLALGKAVRFTKNGRTYEGTVRAVTDRAALEVITQDGEVMLLDSGEISLRLTD